MLCVAATPSIVARWASAAAMNARFALLWWSMPGSFPQLLPLFFEGSLRAVSPLRLGLLFLFAAVKYFLHIIEHPLRASCSGDCQQRFLRLFDASCLVFL